MTERKLCPRVPTPEMQAAFLHAIDRWQGFGGNNGDVWRAMFDAVPAQQDSMDDYLRLARAIEKLRRRFKTAENAEEFEKLALWLSAAPAQEPPVCPYCHRGGPARDVNEPLTTEQAKEQHETSEATMATQAMDAGDDPKSMEGRATIGGENTIATPAPTTTSMVQHDPSVPWTDGLGNTGPAPGASEDERLIARCYKSFREKCDDDGVPMPASLHRLIALARAGVTAEAECDALQARCAELLALFPQLRQAALIDDWHTFDAIFIAAIDAAIGKGKL